MPYLCPSLFLILEPFGGFIASGKYYKKVYLLKIEFEWINPKIECLI